MHSVLSIRDLNLTLKKVEKRNGFKGIFSRFTKNRDLEKIELGKTILKNINLDIERGELLGIIGESGSGKTSLLNSILVFYNKNSFKVSGKIILEGKNIFKINFDRRRKFCTDNVSMILQDSMNSLNPYEKLKKQLFEEYGRNNKNVDIEEIKSYLKEMGLKNIDRVLESYPNELSGGMKQRISIILTLMNKNIKILLADEPTTALDIGNQEKFIKFLKNICLKRGLTLIYVSHDLRVVSKICERIVVLKEGEIVEDAKTSEILNSPKHLYTKELVEAFEYFED